MGDGDLHGTSALRIGCFPVESGAADQFQIVALRPPVQHFANACVIGHELRGVAGAAIGFGNRKQFTTDPMHHPQYLAHAEATTVATIERARRTPTEKVIECIDMGSGKIINMNIVTDTSAVRGVIVCAKDGHTVT